MMSSLERDSESCTDEMFNVRLRCFLYSAFKIREFLRAMLSPINGENDSESETPAMSYEDEGLGLLVVTSLTKPKVRSLLFAPTHVENVLYEAIEY